VRVPVALWRGFASRAITFLILGTPQPTLPVAEFRPPPPPRGYFGPHRVIGLFNPSPAAPVVTAYQRPAPQVKRPAPARAQAGPRGQIAAGIASAIVTPLGTLGPPRPFVFRSPLPPRPRGLWRGLAVKAPPPTAQPYQRPAPYIKRPAPHRAQIGPRGVIAGGTAGPPLVPAAQPYQRPGPYIKRPPPHRAQIGPRGTVAGGVASRIVTPLGSLPAPRKVPTFPPKIGRARVGPLSAIAGGIASPIVTPPPVPTVVPPPVTVLAAPAVPMTIVINQALPMTIDVDFTPPMAVDVTPPGRIAQPGPAHVDPPGQQLITQQPAVLLRPA